MKLIPILEGAGRGAIVRTRSRSFLILLQTAATIFIVSAMLVTSGCVGVAGKPGTAGSGTSVEVSPSTISFGSLTVGKSATHTLTITNTGTKSVTISGISVAGSGFTVKTIALPLALAAAETADVSATFTATASGAASGKIMISTNAPNSPMIVPLTATGVSKASDLTASPASLAFGDVKVGSESTQALHLTNSSSSSMTISAVSVSGPSVSVSGASFPKTLAAGATANFSAVFKPTTAGNASGTLKITSTATNSPDSIGWTATATATSSTAKLTVTPSSVGFGNVPTGVTTTQTIRLANSGDSPLTISGVTSTGSGLSLSGVKTPLTIAAGQSANLTASLKLSSPGTADGEIKITSDAAGSPAQIAWTADAKSSVVTLTSSPSSLSFGNVTVGTTDTLQTTIKNTGNANANISKISISGTGFGLNGSTSSTTLDPGQSVTISVSYDPKTAASNTGKVTIASNATTAQLGVALSGTGVVKSASSSHTVALEWNATPSVVGYYIYRSSKPSGPYARLNSSTDANTSYTDNTVEGGQTYYYVVTSVNSTNIESADSASASATIPTN